MLTWLAPPLTMRKALVVFAALWVGIYAVLAFANLFPHKNGPRCIWVVVQLPSCLLGVRENLTGGLIGGGGALFAAWMAWSAVREQLNADRQIASDQLQASREIAVRIETDAQQFLKEEIEARLDFLKVVWDIVENVKAVKGNDEVQVERRIERAKAIYSNAEMFLARRATLDDLRPEIDKIAARHRRTVLTVISNMDTVFRRIASFKQYSEERKGEIDMWCGLSTDLMFFSLAVGRCEFLDKERLGINVDQLDPAYDAPRTLKERHEWLLSEEAWRRRTQAEGQTSS
jgi:hypothetical protein